MASPRTCLINQGLKKSTFTNFELFFRTLSVQIYKKKFLNSLCNSFAIWHLENKILHALTFVLFILLSFYILIFKNIRINLFHTNYKIHSLNL